MTAKPEVHTHCPYCGKRKRGWRTQHADTLCSECDRRKVGE